MALSHPDDLDADLQLFEQSKSGRMKHYAASKRFLRKDGSYVWVDMHISPVTDKGGKPDDYLCIITDITEQKNRRKP